MWSIRIDSQTPNSCAHFDTKIKVITIKNNIARLFSKTVNRKCERLESCNTMTTLKKKKNLLPKLVQTGSHCSILLSNYAGLYDMYTYMFI